jgi:tRNA modification GTPase
VAEVHTIGSPPLLSAVLERLCAAGARLAAPGEFTLRAFLAGRLDLTQAEAVLGVIDARGEQELRNSLEQMAGGLARPLGDLRDSLLDLLAQLEAGLDFADEDIEFISQAEVASQLDRAATTITRLSEQLSQRSQSDVLARVTLVGWPNVGKSSLFNALAPRGAALVADAPGTTRDYLMAPLDLGSITCQLIDTAGVEPANHAEGDARVSQVAQQFTAGESARAHVRLLCLDASRPLNAWEQQQLAAEPDGIRLVVLTKCDVSSRTILESEAIRTSAVSGLGLDTLRQALRQAVRAVPRGETAAVLTVERCGESLRAASDSLARAAELNRMGGREELVAAEIRGALADLGRVVGAVYTDDILDRIFSRFCIGK